MELNDIYVLLENHDRLDETEALKRGQMFIGRSGRVLQRGSMVADGCEYVIVHEVEEVDDEVVGMPHLQRVLGYLMSWKVTQVSGHDHVRTTANCRSKDVTISNVRQLKPGNESFVAGDDGVREMLIHHRPGPLQLADCEIRAVGEKAVDPFLMDVGAPKGSEQPSVRQTQQDVPQAGRIQDVGVEQRRPALHRLLQAEFLIVCSQRVQRVPAAGLRLPTVGQDVRGPHAPMRPDFAVWDIPVVEQVHQMRP